MPFAFDKIFAGVRQCTSVTNFIILGLRFGNRVRVRVTFRVNIRLIRYSAMTDGAI